MLRLNDGYVTYSKTNESLDAVAVGLSPSMGDRVLSILGSGEQARRLASMGAHVTAVDCNKRQVKFVKREEFLGRMRKFLGMQETSELDGVDVCLGDVFDCQEEVFDSAYLSNALGYEMKTVWIFPIVYSEKKNVGAREETWLSSEDCEIVEGRLKRLVGSVKEGGLLYFSDIDIFDVFLASEYRSFNFNNVFGLDNERTGLARQLEEDRHYNNFGKVETRLWVPSVYRKLGN
jgi:hypothetical protein